MADVTIDLAGLLEEITGLEKIPVGNGSGNPATVTINLILNKVDNKINEEVYTKEEINAMLSTSLYEWVDLGLPSGLKWAAWNVGATKPEEYGLYFAWGETQGYTGITDNKKFSWSDYKWCNGSNTTLTKYNNNSSYGTVDNLSSLTASDDAASAAQSTCRIPTKAEFEELAANTTSTLETLNGINGRRFTSKTNGNSIFIPASGFYNDGSLVDASSGGYCWSSSLLEGISRVSWSLYFNSVGMGVGGYDRYHGRSVRAVLDANVTDIFDPTDYSTREEVDNKIQEVNDKIPTKVSELENDVPYAVDYTLPENGLYIYDTDGNFTLPANWNTANNSKAVGVAILGDDCRFVVAKEDIGQKRWGGYGTDIASLTNYTSSTKAAKDFAGITNTQVIIDAIGQTNDGYRTGSAAQDCVDYIFPNGQAGYLGAAGEWKLARSYKDELNSALELIGGTKMAESYYWTSTEYSSDYAWRHWFDSRSGLISDTKDYSYSVRAFLALEQPKTVKDRISELEAQTASFVTEYATKEEFNNKISELETQTESFVTTNDLSGYATKEELSNTTETTPIINHGTNDSVYALTPNVYHVWGEMTSLELTLSEPTNSNIYNEYMFEFISGETATTLSLPSTIKWVSTPNIESNKIYQCSIVNNVGVIAAASNS